MLHAPNLLCNIIGWPILDDYDVSTSFSDGPQASGFITSLSDGRSIAYFKPWGGDVRFLEVQLSGPPVGPKVGPSPFNSSEKYWLRVFWPDSERERVASLVAARPVRGAAAGSLTSAERAWLKKHYGNEFKLLRDYGLSIYKEQDREEGRAIVRAMMSNDSDKTPVA